MNRSYIYICLGAAWIFLLLPVIFFMFPSMVPYVKIAYLITAIVFGIAILINHTHLKHLKAEELAKRMAGGKYTVEAIREAEKLSAKYLAEGNIKEAIVELENVGMFEKALEIAVQHGEKVLMARLSQKLGKFVEARKLYIELLDFEKAANISNLLEEYEEARRLYGEHSTTLEVRFESYKRAGLMDRAWNHNEAATLYEKVGDLVRASEAKEQAGYLAEAKRLLDLSEVMKAYARKMDGDKSLHPSLVEQRTKFLETQAAELLELGDYFEGAWVLRQLEKYAEAAELYEKLQEWLKAARQWEKAGDKERAKKCYALVKIPLIEESAPIESESLPYKLLDPKDSTFKTGKPNSDTGATNSRTSTSRMSKLPINPASLKAPVNFESVRNNPQLIDLIIPHYYIDGISRTSSLSVVSEWNDFRHYATNLSLLGRLQEAADLHLQAGECRESIECLRDCNERQVAGLVALGLGEYSRAVDFIVDEVTENVDPGLCLILGNILLKLGDAPAAIKLLKSKLAPTIMELHDDIVFRFGLLLEHCGKLQESLDVFQELLAKGNAIPGLQEHINKIKLMLSTGEKIEPEIIPYDPNSPEMQLLSGTQKKMNAWDYISKIFDDDDEVDEAPAILVPPQPAVENPTPAATKSPEAQAFQKPLKQLSLLGSASIDALDPPLEIWDRYEQIQRLQHHPHYEETLARDEMLNRTIFLQQFKSFGLPSEQLKQFLLENRIMARINHPGVWRLTDFGILDLSHYVAYEQVEAISLEEHVSKFGKLPAKEALQILLQCAEALNTVHSSGVVHQGINPQSVFLTPTKKILIRDFGFSKLARQNSLICAPATSVEKSLELAIFASPDLQRDGAELPREDVYSLGILLYHMLTGKHPHDEQQLKSLERVQVFQRSGSLPPLKTHAENLPEGVEHFYRYCTASRVENRYSQMSDLLPSLKQLYEAA